MSRELTMNEVAIRCQACSAQAQLDDAVRNGWQSCMHCGSFVCAECLQDFGGQFQCLSSVCLQAGRMFSSAPIPVDRVLVFARSQQLLEMEDSFLSRVFFDNQSTWGPSGYTLRGAEQPEKVLGDEEPGKVQTETWNGHQLVITRRKRGRFVTWERIHG